MTDSAPPPVITAMLEATNRGDTEAFVASFAGDAVITDFGRTFHGRDGARSWDSTDNIGVGMHFDVRGISETEPGLWSVAMVATSRRFNGPGALNIRVDGGLIASLDTA